MCFGRRLMLFFSKCYLFGYTLLNFTTPDVNVGESFHIQCLKRQPCITYQAL